MSARRVFVTIALLLVAAPTWADVVAGRDYLVLPVAQRTDAPGKVEVIEFFNYGCPYCFQFHPLISKWSAALPSDVVFRRASTSLGHAGWDTFAKAYYAFTA